MSEIFDLNVNGTRHRVSVAPDTPLLWVLRDTLGMTGTKFGCGIGQCGACTVHVDGDAVRACSVPVETLGKGARIETIEALAADPEHPVFAAWEATDVPQCGYCQPGQIMAATAFLKANPAPSMEEIRTGMTNYCRCGTYQQIAAAIALAAVNMKKA
jgi:isoquinoline 1-oxidoreductase alpha subunit